MIRIRCQIYDFSRIEAANIIAHLQSIAAKEGINAEYEALRVVAQKSDGCMRDALSLFDQMASFTQGDLTYNKVIASLNVLDYEYYFRLTDFILEKKTSQTLLLLNDVIGKGFESNIFIEGAASHFRDLLVNSDAETASLFEGSGDLQKRYAEQAKRCTAKFLFNAIRLCNNCSQNYRTSRNKRLLVELTLIELTQAGDGDDDCGRQGPKKLKPIFNTITAAPARPAEAVQPVPSVTPQTQERSTTAPQTQPVARPEREAQPAPPPAIHGRPAELQSQSQRPAGRGIGTMFRGLRNNNAGEPAAATTAGSTTSETPQAAAPQKRKAVTNELLSQAWTSIALQMPENERALADRMKIINPTMDGEESFSISVDNQMVAEMFESEARRICGGMSGLLGGTMLKMKVNVNKVVVERHVSDKGKQFAILKEKNPLIEKLRKELNLEISR